VTVASPAGRRLLVWDFDGTLADTFASIRACATEALDHHGLGPLDVDVLRTTVGLTLPEVMARLAPSADPEVVTSLVAVYQRTFTSRGQSLATLVPGVAGLLDDLVANGLTSAIATGRRRETTMLLLDRFGIGDRFATVHCASDVPAGRGKPHPELVLRACAATSRQPGDAVVIGDSPHDVEMGRAAGATTVAVTWGHAHRDALVATRPDHLVDDLDGLRTLLA
jgi:phosphoglycolate phosphatase